MSILHRTKSFFSRRGKTLTRYRRGMKLARQRDHQGAIEEYTAAMNVGGVPSDLMAMLLFNRALAHMAGGDRVHGVEDLDAVLAMDDAPRNVKTMARQKLVKRKSHSESQS